MCLKKITKCEQNVVVYCSAAVQQMVAEYDARNKLDDEALCASIRCLTTAEVICPVCQK